MMVIHNKKYSDDICLSRTHPIRQSKCKELKSTKICIAPHRDNLTSEALRHGSHSFTLIIHHTCPYLVSVHQTAPPLTSDSSHLIAA